MITELWSTPRFVLCISMRTRGLGRERHTKRPGIEPGSIRYEIEPGRKEGDGTKIPTGDE